MTTRIVDRARTCQAPGCPRRAFSTNGTFCRQCHAVVEAHVESALTSIIALVDGGPLHIGRTVHPERRAFEHWNRLGLNRLTVLHCAHSWEEGDCMEALARRIAGRLGGSVLGTEDEPCGRRSGRFSWIYVAYSEAVTTRRAKKGVAALRDIHPRDRIMPSVEVPTPTVHMRVDMSRAEAETTLEGWWRRTKGERKAG